MAVPDTSYNYSFVMIIGSTPIMVHGQEHSLCVPMVSSKVRGPTIYCSWMDVEVKNILFLIEKQHFGWIKFRGMQLVPDTN